MMRQQRGDLERIDRLRETAAQRAVAVPDQLIDKGERVEMAEQLVSMLAPDSFAADQYRALRHTVEWLRKESGLHVLAVTSPGPGDGKTITTLNLAGALAQSPELRVLVIDADLRRPSVAKYLGVANRRATGLCHIIEDPQSELTRGVWRMERFNLSVLPVDRPQIAPYEILNSTRLDALLTKVRSLYDFVVIDTPPLVPFPDARLIERRVDGLLLIVTAHKTPRTLLSESLNLLDPAKVIGIVFNGAEPPRHDYGYYYNSRSDRRDSWWRRAFNVNARKQKR